MGRGLALKLPLCPAQKPPGAKQTALPCCLKILARSQNGALDSGACSYRTTYGCQRPHTYTGDTGEQPHADSQGAHTQRSQELTPPTQVKFIKR